MGRFSDWVSSIGEWIGDNILSPVAEWIQDTVHTIRTWLRVKKHEVKKKIAKWLENDANFMLAVAAVIVAIIFIPKLLKALKNTKFYETIKVLTKKINEGVVDLVKAQTLIDLKLLNDILRTIWPQYNEVLVSFTEALSSIASDLGEGTAYISAYINAARGVYVGSAAILNLDMRATEIEWYNDAAKFVAGVEDDFRRYASHPGRIYYDWMENHVIPRAEEQRTLSQAQLRQTRENYNRLLVVEGGLETVRDSVNLFVKTLPNEIAEQFEKRWRPIETWLTERLTIINTVLLPMINDLIAAFEEHQQMQAKINAAALDNKETARRMLQAYYTLTDEERAYFDEMYGFGVAEMQGDEQRASEHGLGMISAAADSLTRGIFDRFRDIPALALEPPEYGTKADLPIDIPSPFVGDY